MAGPSEFHPFNKWRFLSFYKDIKALKSQQIVFPRMAIVYPSYVCNQDCNYCFYSSERDEFKGVMYSEEEFYRVINALYNVNVKAIEYCGGGEPTLNPHLMNVTKYGLKLGMKFGLLTNGTNIPIDLARFIIKEFSYIRFSIDSFDEITYNKKRNPNSLSQFNRMMSTLEFMGMHRDSDSKLKVGVKLLIQSDSFDNIKEEIRHALDVCSAWSLDSLQIKRDDFDTELDDVVPMVEDYINNLKDRYDFKILSNIRKTTIKEKCYLNPLQVTIDAKGDVYLCCYFQHRKDRHKLCNIFQEDLWTLWGSKKHKELIEKIDINECNVYNCRFHGYHEIANHLDDFQLEFC